jgi:hypothetical protein
VQRFVSQPGGLLGFKPRLTSALHSMPSTLGTIPIPFESGAGLRPGISPKRPEPQAACWLYILHDDFKSMFAVKGHIRRLRCLQIARHLLSIGLCQYGSKQCAADPRTLPLWLDPNEQEVPVWRLHIALVKRLKVFQETQNPAERFSAKERRKLADARLVHQIRLHFYAPWRKPDRYPFQRTLGREHVSREKAIPDKRCKMGRAQPSAVPFIGKHVDIQRIIEKRSTEHVARLFDLVRRESNNLALWIDFHP